MKHNQYQHWINAISEADKNPAYLVIADLIEADIESGKLQVRNRLPPLRELAGMLMLDYTTVARGYKEAKSRGLVDSRPGSGTFVKGKTNSMRPNRNSNFEMTMNLPPEPRSAAVLEKITAGFHQVLEKSDIYSMFRYQDFGGTAIDKEAGVELLSPLLHNPDRDRLLVCPGIHSALVALLSLLADDSATICVESLVYPGLKAIAAQLGVTLTAIESDSSGPLIRPLENLCKTQKVAAIYLNPTLQNPTTQTFSRVRREAIADVALRYSIPIIEDDAYGLLPKNPAVPIANLAPQLTYYITGLSKCFGAGLRTAYLYTPGKSIAQRVAGALRALSVMSSPITNALTTGWIMDGSLQDMTSAIRREANARQALAKTYLARSTFSAHADGFHLWLNLPRPITANPSVVAAHLRSKGVGVVSSSAFCTDNNPPHAVRLCLGGPGGRQACQEALLLVADMLQHPTHLSSVVL
ncbi:PLP-dependent aminotransferase family protein [Exilibacterium tricleocarpae]|uniref:PLP-dependent aminotransferase family protein n=1 Tax=Exilibacterium tricleocarpae TaxID=2591008 RepID=A0A545U9Y8_9GAMM|nr:PLP-dependent aminotransferase family protein [Exilibacterium tricleocarpae]TQV86281.1 PLP-dependent aminotransferase family protein [Exilibacterium tricleocarpae]